MRELKRQRDVAGNSQTLFARDGGLSNAVQNALHIERMHDALQMALGGADNDCPFYVPTTRGYDGRQTDRNRVTLSLESGGLVNFRRTAGRTNVGGGGHLRILPGYGFGRVSVLGGLEVGGGGLFKLTDTSQLELNFMTALPVIVRFRGVQWHADIESGPVGLFQGENRRLSYGGRIGVALGVSALRTRAVIPWAGVGVAYDYYTDSGGRPTAHILRAGFRVGVQWDGR